MIEKLISEGHTPTEIIHLQAENGTVSTQLAWKKEGLETHWTWITTNDIQAFQLSHLPVRHETL